MLTSARLDFAIAQTREPRWQRCATAVAAKPRKKGGLSGALSTELSISRSYQRGQPHRSQKPATYLSRDTRTFMFTFRHSRNEILCAQRGQSFLKKIGLARWEGAGGRKGNGQAGEDPAEAGSGSAHSPTITKGACSSRKRGLEDSATFSGYESGSEN